MNLDFAPEDVAFRQEVRTWLENDYPAELRGKFSRRWYLIRPASHMPLGTTRRSRDFLVPSSKASCEAPTATSRQKRWTKYFAS